MLKAEHVSVLRGGRTILTDISLHLHEHEWLMLLGPNGAGKTTLAEALSGALPFQGDVTLCGQPLRTLRPRELAKRIGVLSQADSLSARFTVREVVAMGRYARATAFGKPDGETEERVNAALAAVDLLPLKDRDMLTLSGGERRRAFLAQVLCQDPQVLILDEPDSHLDLRYTRILFELVDAWRRQPGKAVLSVEHDLSVARTYATQVMLLANGRSVAYGSPQETMTAEALESVWQTDVVGWVNRLADAWK